MSASGQALVPADVRPLIKEARDRQRRRRRRIVGALGVSLGIAVVVVVVGGRGSGPSPGGPPGLSTAAGSPSSRSRTERTLSARRFVRYGISCQDLREAAIPIGRDLSWWCKPHSLTLVSNGNGTHSIVFTSDARGTLSPDNNYGIVFGMSKEQVLHLLGKPTTRRGRCWQYELLPGSRAAVAGVAARNVGVCFFADRVSDMSSVPN